MSTKQTEDDANLVAETQTEDIPTEPETVHATESFDDTQTEAGTAREAARYRRQLREVEAERDTLLHQLDAIRRAEVDRRVDDAGMKPAALWATGTQLEGLLTADGTIDPQKVTTAIQAAADTLGFDLRQIRAARMNGVIPNEGIRPEQDVADAWGKAFGPTSDDRG